VDNFKPTYLYIKQHEVTGLQYFGKTTRKNVEGYLGSGKHWKRHIRKHGTNYVKTTWYMLFTNSVDLTAFALKFSQDNDIVESKEWANLIEENGIDGGFTGSYAGCFKKGVRNSPETEFKKGECKGNPRIGPCLKCGSEERGPKGCCKPCKKVMDAAWKKENKGKHNAYNAIYNKATKLQKEFNDLIFN